MTSLSLELPLKSTEPEALPLDHSPSCATWDLWAGPEVEGEDQIGVPTLFVRRLHPRLSVRQFVQRVSRMGFPFRRVWLCKEFVAHHMPSVKKAESVLLHFTSGLSGPMIAVEVDTPHAYQTVHEARRQPEFGFRVAIFVKIPWVAEPHAQDHICLGPAFHDMCFRVGAPKAMRPAQYASDISLNALAEGEVSDSDLRAAGQTLVRAFRR